MNMKRVLLTGAGGFVAHHALEHILVMTDWEIVCIDSFRHRGKTDRIREVLDGLEGMERRVKVLTHDLRAPISKQLDHEIGPIQYVLSIASESHVDRSITEPRPFIENNVALVLTLLEWTRERSKLGPDGVQKFIHLSTDEVYGPAAADHNHAEGEPHRPSNPYAASKAAQEAILYSYWRTYGFPVGIVNSMNLIGERQDPEKFVPLVLSRVLAGEKVPIHASADGQTVGSRFYLHCRNLADGVLFLLRTQPVPRYGETMPDSQGVLTAEETERVVAAGGGLSLRRMAAAESEIRATKVTLAEMGRWNVVGEREVNNLEMAGLIAGYAGEIDFEYELVNWHESRPGHDLRYALDGSKMRDLGWTPPVPLEASLRKTVEWTLSNPHWMLD